MRHQRPVRRRLGRLGLRPRADPRRRVGEVVGRRLGRRPGDRRARAAGGPAQRRHPDVRRRWHADAAQRLTRVEIDAMTDGLTGLYNHRYLHERLAEEIGVPSPRGTQLSLLFCDVDQLQGHQRPPRSQRRRRRRCAHGRSSSARRSGASTWPPATAATSSPSCCSTAAPTARSRSPSASARRSRDAGLHPGGETSTVSIGVATLPGDADQQGRAARQGRLGDVPRQAPRAQPLRALQRGEGVRGGPPAW